MRQAEAAPGRLPSGRTSRGRPWTAQLPNERQVRWRLHVGPVGAYVEGEPVPVPALGLVVLLTLLAVAAVVLVLSKTEDGRIFVRSLLNRSAAPRAAIAGQSAVQSAHFTMESGPVPPEVARLLGAPPFPIPPRRHAIGAALRHRWDVAIIYCDAHGEWTARRLSPEWLGGARSGMDRGRAASNLFGGRCHLAQDDRTFRLDRVRAVEVLHQDHAIRDRYRVS